MHCHTTPGMVTPWSWQWLLEKIDQTCNDGVVDEYCIRPCMGAEHGPLMETCLSSIQVALECGVVQSELRKHQHSLLTCSMLQQSHAFPDQGQAGARAHPRIALCLGALPDWPCAEQTGAAWMPCALAWLVRCSAEDSCLHQQGR